MNGTPLQTSCGTCGKVINFQATMLGTSSKCPQCGELMRLTDPNAVVEAPQPSVISPISNTHPAAWGCLGIMVLFGGCVGLGMVFGPSKAERLAAKQVELATAEAERIKREAEQMEQLRIRAEKNAEKNALIREAYSLFKTLIANSSSANYVTSTSLGENYVVIEVADQFVLSPSAWRKMEVEGLEKAWGSCLEIAKSDLHSSIHLVNRNGTKIGGSKIFGGVWVDE